jgi:hypothetical protein
MSSKEEAMEYLRDIREHYNNYHEHKERSAWAAVVLYVLFAGTLLPIQLRGPDTYLYDLGYVAFILIVALVVFGYTRNQFDLKNEGRVYVAASMQLLLELMAMDEDEFDSGEFFEVPKSTGDSYYDSEETLPPILLKRADKFRNPGISIKPSVTSRVLCYAIILIMTIGLLAARFIL